MPETIRQATRLLPQLSRHRESRVLYNSASNKITATAQQTQGIKGTVTDGAGDPLIGATIKVVGTQNGTVTDLDGKFSINCKTGATLEISFIGYKTIQVQASNGMTVKLEEDGKVLQDVVVTALGIKRDRKALGYGLTEIKGEELTKGGVAGRCCNSPRHQARP